ncbi:MAG: AMP-binding protein [Acidimicrobiia bacterium]
MTCATHTIDALLAERARTHADVPFLRFAGVDLTFATVAADVDRLALGLATLGVRPRSLVAVILPNCPEFVLSWFALARLGAVEAPVNTAFRGPALAHLLELTEAEVLIVDESMCDGVAAVADSLTHVRVVVVRGDPSPVRALFPAVGGALVRGRVSWGRLRTTARVGARRERPGDAALHIGHHRPLEGLRPVAPLCRSPGRAGGRAPRPPRR